MQKSCSVLIYGSGAVGSIFGWRIAQNPHTKVSVVCRSNYERVRESGFHLQTKAWGNGPFMPYQVFSSSTFFQNPPRHKFDYVICANKFTDDCVAILRDLGQVVGPNTTLVAAQNGMDVELPLKRAFPNNTILSAICNVGCSQDRPGLIHQTAGMNPMAFLIGVFGQSEAGLLVDTQRRDALVAMDSKFASIDDVRQQRWKKLIFNGTWNATSTLTDLDTQQAARRPEALRLATFIAHEACRVAASTGVDLGEGYAASVIELAAKSGAMTPSTLQDARNKRPMEIASIWGYLVTQAALGGIDTPVTNMVYDLLQHMNNIFTTAEHIVDEESQVQQSFWNSQPSPQLPVTGRNHQRIPSWLSSDILGFGRNPVSVALA